MTQKMTDLNPLKKNDRVVIRNSGTIWDGVEGVVKYFLPLEYWPIGVTFDGGFNGFKLEEVELVDA